MENDTLRDRLRGASVSEKVSLLFDYVKKYGQHNYEEQVTQYAHAVQAAYLAKEENSSDEMITAALLHDIGHMLADDPDEANNPTVKNDLHEELAAAYFQDIFPPSVTEPIRLHVPSKRYLCTTDETYYDGLSDASKKSFHLQGGHMSPDEQTAFESNPYYKEALRLRIWDDKAKIVGQDFPEIDTYAPYVGAVLRESM